MEAHWRYASFMSAPEIRAVMRGQGDWRLFTESNPTEASPYFQLNPKTVKWKAWVYPDMPPQTRERLMLLRNILERSNTHEAKDRGKTVWGFTAQPARWMIDSPEFQILGLSGSEKGEPVYGGTSRFEALRQILCLPEGAGAERWFFDIGTRSKTLKLSITRIDNTLSLSTQPQPVI